MSGAIAANNARYTAITALNNWYYICIKKALKFIAIKKKKLKIFLLSCTYYHIQYINN